MTNYERAHALFMKSRTPKESTVTMLYRAECSCGGWKSPEVPATEARALHAAHLQEMLGPDRELTRAEHLERTCDAAYDSGDDE